MCAAVFILNLPSLVDIEGIRSPDGLQFEIGYDFIEAAMIGGPSTRNREL